MYDMILGPNALTSWAGSNWAGPAVMPKSRFHFDYSRVAFPAAVAQVDPLWFYSYGVAEQQPAAITAAIGATAADEFDTSINTAFALSKTCVATHMGITIDRVALVNAADVNLTFLATRIGLPRITIRTYWAENMNEVARGLIEDYPEGIGLKVTDPTAGLVWAGAFNGEREMSNIKPLPKPLPCKGGQTYFAVKCEPSVRDGGCTHATVTSYTCRVYGVSPAKIQPGEGPKRAFQAIASAAR